VTENVSEWAATDGYFSRVTVKVIYELFTTSLTLLVARVNIVFMGSIDKNDGIPPAKV
jgi:hypothetical protein